MANSELEGILRRIEKLMAIANCPGANPNEAAAAASMVEKIMRKYQLEHKDILIASLNRGEGMGTEDVVATAKTNGTKVQRVPLWANWICVPLAQLCEVEVSQARTANRETCIRFYGLAEDVKMASWMFSYLVETVNILCITFRKTDPRYFLGGKKEVNSYRVGVAKAITHNLNKLIKEKAQEQQTTGKELVVAKAAAIQLRFNLKTELVAKNSNVGRSSSYYQGVEDGNKVDLKRRGIESSGQAIGLEHLTKS